MERCDSENAQQSLGELSENRFLLYTFLTNDRMFGSFRYNSTIQKLYGNVDKVDERHRHRYEVNPDYVLQLEKEGMLFVGHDEEKTRMEVIELKDHPYYVGVQFHPEYLTRPLKPSPPFLGLILASVNKLNSFLGQGCRVTPRQSSDDSSDGEDSQKNLNTSTASDKGRMGLPSTPGSPTRSSGAVKKANKPTTSVASCQTDVQAPTVAVTEPAPVSPSQTENTSKLANQQ